MSQLIKGDKLLTLPKLKNFWGSEFEDYIKFLAGVNILVD